MILGYGTSRSNRLGNGRVLGHSAPGENRVDPPGFMLPCRYLCGGLLMLTLS